MLSSKNPTYTRVVDDSVERRLRLEFGSGLLHRGIRGGIHDDQLQALPAVAAHLPDNVLNGRVAAFRIAIDRGRPGVFNVVGDGILPLSKVVRLVGRPAAPLPLPVASSVATMMWTGQLAPWPPSFLPYLRYVCVADGGRAAEELGFRPAYTTQEALMDFVSAQRLRDVRLAQQVDP